MTNPVKDYLDKIGPRALTSAEARELQLIRLRHGLEKPGSVIENILAVDARREK